MNPLFFYLSHRREFNEFYQTVRNYIIKEAKNWLMNKLEEKNLKTIVVSVGSTLIICKVWSSYSDCQDGVMSAAKKKFFKTLRFVHCSMFKLMTSLND